MKQQKRVRTWIGLYTLLLLLAAATLRAGADPPPADLAAAPQTATVTQVINGLADTMVVEGYPTANCADTLGGYFGYDAQLTPPGKIVRTLVRFNLAQIPPGAVISKANLEVYVSGMWGYEESLPLNVHRLTGPWVSPTTTWNRQPAIGELLASKPLPFAIGHWETLDLTGVAQKWHDGTYPNHGIVLRGREAPLGWRVIGRSKTTTPPRLRVTYQHTAGFSLWAVPSTHTLQGGQTVSSLVYVDETGGFSQPVNLSVEGLPANATHALVRNPLTPPGQTSLQISTTQATPGGTYKVTLTGQAGGQSRTAVLHLNVRQPDFDLSVDPAQRSVVAGGQARYTVRMDAVSGFAAPVTLSLSGLPPTVAQQWTQNPVTPTASSTLVLTTQGETPIGSYPLTITATGGGRTHSAQARLLVNRRHYLPMIPRNYPPAGAVGLGPEVEAAGGPASVVMLAIGIADYEHMDPPGAERAGIPGSDLVLTVPDAEETAGTVRENCGCPEVVGGVSAQCSFGAYKLLLDAQATKAAIHDAIVNWMAPLVEPDTTVVIAFSGHGMYGPDDDGDDGDGRDEFLVPYEIASKDGKNWDETMAIRDDELAEWLDALQSQRIVLLIDSCFSGGMFDASALSSRALGAPIVGAAEWQHGFVQDIEGSGRVILTASAENEESMESGKLGHGAFTYYLLEALRSPAADRNGDGWISAQEAYAYLANRVTTFVKGETGDNQHPQMSDQTDGPVNLTRPQAAPAACPFGP